MLSFFKNKKAEQTKNLLFLLERIFTEIDEPLLFSEIKEGVIRNICCEYLYYLH